MSQSSKKKWDLRFLGLAEHVAQWSKDPSTKTGAVIVDEDHRVISVGFNGHAKNIVDTDERLYNRDLKYKLIIHAERNALLFAERSLKGCTLYVYPFAPCLACASMVIQSGIKRVVSPVIPPHLVERWGEELKMSTEIFMEAGVRVNVYDTSALSSLVGVA